MHADDRDTKDTFDAPRDDPNETRLNLARSYLDMGDPEGATSVLDELFADPASTQVQRLRAIRICREEGIKRGLTHHDATRASTGPEPDQAAHDPTNHDGEAFCTLCQRWVAQDLITAHLASHARENDAPAEDEAFCLDEPNEPKNAAQAPPEPEQAPSGPTWLPDLLNHLGAAAWFVAGVLIVLAILHRMIPGEFGLLTAVFCVLIAAAAYSGSYVAGARAGARARKSITVLHRAILGGITEQIRTNEILFRLADGIEQIPSVVEAGREATDGSLDGLARLVGSVNMRAEATHTQIERVQRTLDIATPAFDGRGALAYKRLFDMANNIEELRKVLEDIDRRVQARMSPDFRLIEGLINGIAAQRSDAIGFLENMRPAPIFASGIRIPEIDEGPAATTR